MGAAAAKEAKKKAVKAVDPNPVETAERQPGDDYESYIDGYQLGFDIRSSLTADEVKNQIGETYMITHTSFENSAWGLSKLETEHLSRIAKELKGSVFTVKFQSTQTSLMGLTVTFFTIYSEILSVVMNEVMLRAEEREGQPETKWSVVVEGGENRMVKLDIGFFRLRSVHKTPNTEAANVELRRRQRPGICAPTDDTKQLRF